MEVLSLKTVITANLLAWLIKPMGPHLIEAIPRDHPHMAMVVLWTLETLHDAEASKVGVGLVYKAPYIQTISFCEAYFSLKSASSTEVVQRPQQPSLLFLCVSAMSQVIPHAVERTLFLDVRDPNLITESNVLRSPQVFRGFRLQKVCLSAHGITVTQVAVPRLRGEMTYHTIPYERHPMLPEYQASSIISAPLAEKDEAHWNLLNNQVFLACLGRFRDEEEASARTTSLEVGDASDAVPMEATSVAPSSDAWRRPSLTSDEMAELVDKTITEINALRLQSVQDMVFIRETDRALARALMSEFMRLHLIVGGHFNTSLHNLQTELEAGTDELIRDLDVTCHHSSGVVSTESPVRVTLECFHTWVRLKVALPLAQLDAARDDMEKFLIFRVSEQSSQSETQSLLETFAHRLEAHQSRVKQLIRSEFLHDPEVCR